MVERVSLARVQRWGCCNFVDLGYDFDIRMESFGDTKFPVVHISLTRRKKLQCDFPIVLDNYEPKHPDSDDWDYGDKVIIDFDLVARTFDEEIRKFYNDFGIK